MHGQIKIQEAQVVAPEINQWDECRYPTIRTYWKLSSKPRSHVEPIQPPPRGVPSVQAANLMISRVKASGDPSKIWHLQNKPMMLSWWQWCLKDVWPRHMIMHHTSQVTLLLMAALFWGCHWMLENPLASLVPGLHFFKRYASVLQDFQIPNGRYRKILSYLGASPWPPQRPSLQPGLFMKCIRHWGCLAPLPKSQQSCSAMIHLSNTSTGHVDVKRLA